MALVRNCVAARVDHRDPAWSVLRRNRRWDSVPLATRFAQRRCDWRKHRALPRYRLPIWARRPVAFASIQARSKDCGWTDYSRARRYLRAGSLFHRRAHRIAMSNVSVIIPALNEEEPIAQVVRECLMTGIPNEIIVVDNGSTDPTAQRARDAGGSVVSEPQHGYGRACLAGIRAVAATCEIIVFLDGDGSDCPEFMLQLVDPIVAGNYDFVIGSRTRGQRERGSMNFQQIFAGHFAGWLISILYRVRYTDMCPFRAIRRDALEKLGMREQTYGWNLEMQMKAARAGLRILEMPVNHRRRAGGVSKVSGTLRGTFVAGTRIIATFVRIASKQL